MNKHLQRFLNEKVAVRLRTQDEWNQFMEILERETDAVWWDARPTQLNFWKKQKEMTSIVYGFGGGDFLGYSRYGFFEDEGYEIVEFQDIIKEEKSMTIAEKLRFLADRAEDGKDFYIEREKYSLNEGKLVVLRTGFESGIPISDLKYWNFKLAPRWEFTEDEKVILRNLPDDYQWIARDKTDNGIWIYNVKPIKDNQNWRVEMDNPAYLRVFTHLFKSIQWSDDEPCEFRKYL